MTKKIVKKEMVKNMITLKPMNWKYINIHIKGTDLLMERDDGTCAEYYDKKKGQKVVKEDTRLEEEKVEGKIHHTDDGKVGYPSSGFSTGMRKVAYSESNDRGMSMRVKEAIRFLEPMIPIGYEKMTVNNVLGKRGGVPAKIMRPQFKNWTAVLRIRYDADLISLEQLLNLVNKTGVRRGIGGWRPEKGGIYGQYEVVSAA